MKARKLLILAAALALCAPSWAGSQLPGFDLDKHIGARWYGVYIGGKKTGYALEKLEKIKYDGRSAYKFRMDLDITISVMGQSQKMQTKDYRIFYPDGPLAECSSSMGPQSWRGIVNGDTMTLITTLGGAKSEKTIPAPEVSLDDEIAPLRLIMKKPKPGESIESRMFYPMMGRTITAVITVIGKKNVLFRGVKLNVYEINTAIKEMGINAPALITEQAEMLQLTLPAGGMKLVLKLEDEKTAKDPSVETVEILDASLIRPSGKMPPAPRNKLRLHLTGLKNEECIINNERQSYKKLDDGSYELTLSRDTLPKDSPDIPVADAEVREYTKPTDLYQSDHPDIVKKAREIIGSTKHSARAAQLLCLWVFTNVAKRGTVTLSNALETLHAMEGDCGEHAALFVGLCRAVGLPARFANGIAYSNELRAFGGHAWAEVYVGKWIAADPTFGQLVADPARIKFADDDIIQSARLLQIIGEIEIEVLEPKD